MAIPDLEVAEVRIAQEDKLVPPQAQDLSRRDRFAPAHLSHGLDGPGAHFRTLAVKDKRPLVGIAVGQVGNLNGQAHGHDLLDHPAGGDRLIVRVGSQDQDAIIGGKGNCIRGGRAR